MSEQKLSERLRQLANEARAGARETLLGTYYEARAKAFDEAARLAQSLEAKNERLRKRVAELEAKQCAHEAELAVAHEFIADLQSQLAWHPVSAGLPTEPGYYLFTDGHNEQPHQWNKAETEPAPGISWWLVNKRWFDSPLHYCSYTHYRRVELPNGGES